MEHPVQDTLTSLLMFTSVPPMVLVLELNTVADTQAKRPRQCPKTHEYCTKVLLCFPLFQDLPMGVLQILDCC